MDRLRLRGARVNINRLTTSMDTENEIIVTLSVYLVHHLYLLVASAGLLVSLSAYTLATPPNTPNNSLRSFS